MKRKLLPILSIMAAITLVGCGEAKSAAPATSKTAVTSKANTSKANTSKAPESKAPASKEAPHEDVWTAGTTVANSDGKTCTNYTCTCGKKAVGIALTDCVADDAGNIASDGKIKLGSTTRWKIVAPKAGACTLMMAAKLSSAFIDQGSPATAFMNTYEIKAGDTAGEVTFIGKDYVADLELNADDYKYYEVGTLTVAEGENVISFTTPSQQYYRLCNGAEVRLVFAA